MSKETLKEAIAKRLELQGRTFELIESAGAYFLTFDGEGLFTVLTDSCLNADDLDAIRDLIAEHMP